ncbi:MAG: 2-oxo acid dehydrogenase subunit E2, partial [Chloroflexota bacterium]
GDLVQLDEPVLVVETEKVAIEVPAPAGGILAGICAKVGDIVPVTQVIAYILQPGEILPGLPTPAHPDASPTRTAPVIASPVAQRVARVLGLDLTEVPPTGERITREDVERYAASRTSPSGPAPAPGRVTVPATPAARRLSREQGIDLSSLSGSGPRGRVQAKDVVAAPALPVRPSTQHTPEPAPSSAPSRPAEILPLMGMRRKIAERMQASFHDAPHISLAVEVDVTALEAVRQRLNTHAAAMGDPKITLTALLVCMAAWALERHPMLNASLLDDQIYLWKDVNVGIATSIPDGLIVPVIHKANRKLLHEIVAELQDLTTRAKDGKLTLADVQQGTFTISNLGMFGIRRFQAILNPPESAILGVGSVVRKPVVINEHDEVAVRPVLELTLSADHRLVDGVAAAHFLSDLVKALESPELVLY